MRKKISVLCFLRRQRQETGNCILGRTADAVFQFPTITSPPVYAGLVCVCLPGAVRYVMAESTTIPARGEPQLRRLLPLIFFSVRGCSLLTLKPCSSMWGWSSLTCSSIEGWTWEVADIFCQSGRNEEEMKIVKRKGMITRKEEVGEKANMSVLGKTDMMVWTTASLEIKTWTLLPKLPNISICFFSGIYLTLRFI